MWDCNFHNSECCGEHGWSTGKNGRRNNRWLSCNWNTRFQKGFLGFQTFIWERERSWAFLEWTLDCGGSILKRGNEDTISLYDVQALSASLTTLCGKISTFPNQWFLWHVHADSVADSTITHPVNKESYWYRCSTVNTHIHIRPSDLFHCNDKLSFLTMSRRLLPSQSIFHFYSQIVETNARENS